MSGSVLWQSSSAQLPLPRDGEQQQRGVERGRRVFGFLHRSGVLSDRWFQASCAAAFLALLWGLYRYRLHQIAREFNVRLEERVGERTRLARDLHDTLLQGFQGLMLRLQAIDESLPPGEVRTNSNGLWIARIRWSPRAGRRFTICAYLPVITNDLARAVRALGDELSSEGAATFGLMVEGETRELHPIVRDEVYRITREALRNAFSHARAASY
jgi:signal transduction histidine kinase